MPSKCMETGVSCKGLRQNLFDKYVVKSGKTALGNKVSNSDNLRMI